MVQVAGITYRITLASSGVYQVTRILDDVIVGAFTAGPPIRVTSQTITPEELLSVARAAIQNARTS